MTSLQKIALAPLIAGVLILALPLALAVGACWLLTAAIHSAAVSFFWIPRGIRFLVVYSDSAQWRPYFEETVLPALGRSARVINLSRDGGHKRSWHLSWSLYQLCGGFRNRFPIVIRFSRFGTWHSLRFYDAYMQAKKGKNTALDRAKAQLSLWTA